VTANDKIIKLFALKEGIRGKYQDKDITDDFDIDLDTNTDNTHEEKELSVV
jgi:hypothetical protein